MTITGLQAAPELAMGLGKCYEVTVAVLGGGS